MNTSAPLEIRNGGELVAMGDVLTVSQHFLARGVDPDNLAAWRRKERGIWKILSWQAAIQEVANVADRLSDAGLGRGETAILHCDKGYRWVTAAHAIQGLGATVVPIMPDASASELRHCLKQIPSPKVVLAEDEEKAQTLSVIFSELDCSPRIFAVRTAQTLDSDLGQADSDANVKNVGRVIEAWPVSSKRDPEVALKTFQEEVKRGQPEDIATLIFQTGSQDALECISITHKDWIENATSFGRSLNLSHADETICTVAPAYAAANILYQVAPSMYGYCVNFPETRDTILADLREIGPTQLLVTPSGYKHIAVTSMSEMASAGWIKRKLFKTTQDGFQKSLSNGDMQGIGVGPAIGAAFLCKSMREVLGLARVKSAITYPVQMGMEGRAFFASLGLRFHQILEDKQPAGLLPKLNLSLQDLSLSNSASRVSTNPTVIFEDKTFNVDIGLEENLCASPYIKRAVVVSKDSADATALIELDIQASKDWADQQGVYYKSVETLALQSEVLDLIEGEIRKITSNLTECGGAILAKVAQFILLRRPLDRNQGELTHLRMPSYQRVVTNYSALLRTVGLGKDNDFIVGAMKTGKYLSLRDKCTLDHRGVLLVG